MEHPTEFNVLETDAYIFVRRGFEYDVPDGFWYLCTYAYRQTILIDIYAHMNHWPHLSWRTLLQSLHMSGFRFKDEIFPLK